MEAGRGAAAAATAASSAGPRRRELDGISTWQPRRRRERSTEYPGALYDAASSQPQAATTAPTAAEDWTALWTEGTADSSYVWVMESADEGVLATVLIDTTGDAQGVVMGQNESYTAAAPKSPRKHFV